jgi:hypothetical protein
MFAWAWFTPPDENSAALTFVVKAEALGAQAANLG